MQSTSKLMFTGQRVVANMKLIITPIGEIPIAQYLKCRHGGIGRHARLRI